MPERHFLKSSGLSLASAFLFFSILAMPASAQDLNRAAKLNSEAGKLSEQARFKEGISKAEEAVAIRERLLGPEHKDTGNSLNTLGVLYWQTGDYQRAEPLYKRSVSISEKLSGTEHPDTGIRLHNLAGLYVAIGDYQKAEPISKRALAINEKGAPLMAALSLGGMASIYVALGDYQKAEQLYKRSLAVREKAFGPNHELIASNLGSLANLYVILGDYQKAELLFKRALTIHDRASNDRELASASLSFNNLALLYKTLGDYQKAEPLFKRALAIRERIYGTENFLTNISLYNLGFFYIDINRLDEAYEIFSKRNNSLGLGSYYLAKKDYTQAEQHFTRSLEDSKKTGRLDVRIASCIGLGLSSEGMGNYSKAKEYFQEAINIIEKQWQTLSPQAKKEFMTGRIAGGYNRLEPYEGMIRILLKEKGVNAAKDSLNIAESVKGRLFLEMLATRQLKGRMAQDEAMLSKDRRFQQDIAAFRKRIEIMEGLKVKLPQEEIDVVKKEFIQKEKDYSAFIEEVKLKGGELTSLITIEPLSPAKLQSLLDNNTSLLEYFTSKDAIYAWLVTRNDIKVYEIPAKVQDIQNRINAFLLPNISNRSVKLKPVMTVAIEDNTLKEITEKERIANRMSFQKEAQSFYTLLLSPIEKDIKTQNLIIVPHGVLHKIPFAALSDGKQNLVDKYPLSILPSASVLEYVIQKRKPARSAILALANPKTDYTSLDFAEKEGNAISKLFAVSEVHTRDKATETLAKDKSSSFNIIHFASHGEFNEMQPLQSGLLLAKDRENDGFLQVHEIFSLDLKNATLVTLSACDTALSKIQAGDDLVGLSRGFIYAGTPSILATLWEVSDESTSILMEHFYKNWLKGMTKPEALRQAQLTLKNMPQYTHPFYWAPFVMIGDWQ